jgi:ABC-type uncharacterized transport system ATPase component
MPKKTMGYTQTKNQAKKRLKQYQADDRQANYDSLTIAEKISLAVSRGGSKRELARLDKQNESTTTTTTLPTVKPTKVPKTPKKKVA